jgi:hypothetical protein
MTTTKTLIIAARVLVSLAVGSTAAMAQDGASPASDYWGSKDLDAIMHQTTPQKSTVSPIEYRSFLLHSAPVQDMHGTVGSDGSAG